MVSKSYVVNECPKFLDDDDKCVKNVTMQNSDQMKRIDRYILHIGNEMVSGVWSGEAREEKEDASMFDVCNKNN